VNENIMKALQDISGYRGGVISNYTGECLICDTIEVAQSDAETSATFSEIFQRANQASQEPKPQSTLTKAEIEESAATFNEVFRRAHRASHGLNLGNTEVMEIQMEQSIVLMACSGEEERVYIHIFAIFAKNGNIGLGKIAIQKILRQVTQMLS